MFDADMFVSAADSKMLNPDFSEVLMKCGIKSVVVLPLSSGSFNYGYVGFDECTANREWDDNEVELLKNLSKILSGVKRRFQAETSLRQSQQTMRTVLNNINANIVATDFETMNILFVNDQFKKMTGENVEGKKCWEVLEVDKKGECDYCPRKYLLDSDNRPTGVYRCEHYVERFKQHMTIDAMAIEWTDGRTAMLEVAFDITDRKNAEIELAKHHEKLEYMVKERTEELHDCQRRITYYQ
jgi:PAS domain S-box-containing protein